MALTQPPKNRPSSQLFTSFYSELTPGQEGLTMLFQGKTNHESQYETEAPNRKSPADAHSRARGGATGGGPGDSECAPPGIQPARSRGAGGVSARFHSGPGQDRKS